MSALAASRFPGGPSVCQPHDFIVCQTRNQPLAITAPAAAGSFEMLAGQECQEEDTGRMGGIHQGRLSQHGTSRLPAPATPLTNGLGGVDLAPGSGGES